MKSKEAFTVGVGVEEENQGRLQGRGVHPGPGRGRLRSRRWGAGVSIKARLQPLPREGRGQRWSLALPCHVTPGTQPEPSCGVGSQGVRLPHQIPHWGVRPTLPFPPSHPRQPPILLVSPLFSSPTPPGPATITSPLHHEPAWLATLLLSGPI